MAELARLLEHRIRLEQHLWLLLPQRVPVQLRMEPLHLPRQKPHRDDPHPSSLHPHKLQHLQIPLQQIQTHPPTHRLPPFIAPGDAVLGVQQLAQDEAPADDEVHHEDEVVARAGARACLEGGRRVGLVFAAGAEAEQDGLPEEGRRGEPRDGGGVGEPSADGRVGEESGDGGGDGERGEERESVGRERRARGKGGHVRRVKAESGGVKWGAPGRRRRLPGRGFVGSGNGGGAVE
mmetsp:Transcript_19226/g.51010  ORF Transcript_19226/g.51010 Transcript_19226/m.51010 type:complete len:235 (+) Transcript_19226:1508-2212(+)